ncbi:hypothetical protein [Actinophytocola sp.]|uniref:hypothetical protein n=1 Tax=Actinophytocola sp. TaxID=1872138 RepID=UPI003D6AEC3D
MREALGILLGGNFGEIAFTVLGSALTGRSPLNARQLLLVNLPTDLASALAIALSHPSRRPVEVLLRESPGVSLGTALNRGHHLAGGHHDARRLGGVDLRPARRPCWRR